MPKDYLALDTNFPSFTGTETTDQKVDQLYNYTYMLLENLRYTLRNLDGSNFTRQDCRRSQSRSMRRLKTWRETSPSCRSTRRDLPCG